MPDLQTGRNYRGVRKKWKVLCPLVFFWGLDQGGNEQEGMKCPWFLQFLTAVSAVSLHL